MIKRRWRQKIISNTENEKLEWCEWSLEFSRYDNTLWNFRASLMLAKYSFNPQRCNSASTKQHEAWSSCIQRTHSKVIIALPTDSETVEIFKKTLISGFSCVNTRLAFDTDILMLNVKPDLAAGEFQERKRQDLKIVYSLKSSDDEKHKNYRLLSKILFFFFLNFFSF